jgi:hypothetical protein
MLCPFRHGISIANSGVTRSYTLGYGTSPVNPYDIMSITDTAATGHPFASQSHGYSYDNVDRLDLTPQNCSTLSESSLGLIARPFKAPAAAPRGSCRRSPQAPQSY